MKIKRLFITLTLGLGLTVTMLWTLAIMAPVIRAAGTLTVCASGCDYTMIQSAVNAAVAGDTIDIQMGTYNEDYILITKSLTLQGAGIGNTIVDGGQNDRVFQVEGNQVSVTLLGMTIQNGKAGSGEDGGAINYETEDATHVISDCLITGNSADVYGGAIRLVGSGPGAWNNALTIINSEVSTNTAGEEGGGIHIDGQQKVKLINSTISNNTAGGHAGGIYFGSSEADLHLVHSTIISNRANANGGGLLVAQKDAQVYIPLPLHDYSQYHAGYKDRHKSHWLPDMI